MKAYKILIREKNMDGTAGAVVDETRLFQTYPEAASAKELMELYFNTNYMNIEIHTIEFDA